MAELTAEKILREISTYMSKDISYIDALVYYAEKHDVEIEVIGEIVRRSPVLKSKIREDAEKLRLVEKTNSLPI